MSSFSSSSRGNSSRNKSGNGASFKTGRGGRDSSNRSYALKKEVQREENYYYEDNYEISHGGRRENKKPQRSKNNSSTGFVKLTGMEHVLSRFRVLLSPFSTSLPQSEIHWNDVIAVEDKKEESNCPVCLGEANFPRMTKCGHIFCSVCIFRHIKSSSTLKCPVCLDPMSKHDLRIVINKKDKELTDLLRRKKTSTSSSSTKSLASIKAGDTLNFTHLVLPCHNRYPLPTSNLYTNLCLKDPLAFSSIHSNSLPPSSYFSSIFSSSNSSLKNQLINIEKLYINEEDTHSIFSQVSYLSIDIVEKIYEIDINRIFSLPSFIWKEEREGLDFGLGNAGINESNDGWEDFSSLIIDDTSSSNKSNKWSSLVLSNPPNPVSNSNSNESSKSQSKWAAVASSSIAASPSPTPAFSSYYKYNECLFYRQAKNDPLITFNTKEDYQDWELLVSLANQLLALVASYQSEFKTKLTKFGEGNQINEIEKILESNRDYNQDLLNLISSNSSSLDQDYTGISINCTRNKPFPNEICMENFLQCPCTIALNDPSCPISKYKHFFQASDGRLIFLDELSTKILILESQLRASNHCSCCFNEDNKDNKEEIDENNDENIKKNKKLFNSLPVCTCNSLALNVTGTVLDVELIKIPPRNISNKNSFLNNFKHLAPHTEIALVDLHFKSPGISSFVLEQFKFEINKRYNEKKNKLKKIKLSNIRDEKNKSKAEALEDLKIAQIVKMNIDRSLVEEKVEISEPTLQEAYAEFYSTLSPQSKEEIESEQVENSPSISSSNKLFITSENKDFHFPSITDSSTLSSKQPTTKGAWGSKNIAITKSGKLK